MNAENNTDIVYKLPELVIDPDFKKVVQDVGPLNFSQLQKPIDIALINTIIAQKAGYSSANKIKAKIYNILGNSYRITKLDCDKLIGIIPNDVLNIIRGLKSYLQTKPDSYLSSSDNIYRLTEVKGITSWCIKIVLITTGLDADSFCPEDYYIRQRLKYLYNLPQIPTVAEAEKISEKWLFRMEKTLEGCIPQDHTGVIMYGIYGIGTQKKVCEVNRYLLM